MRIRAAILVWIASESLLLSQAYKQPPPDIVSLVLAPPPPLTSASPTHEAILMVEHNPNPSISLLARPYARLAGIRIDTALNCRQLTTEYTGLWVRWLWQEAPVRIQLPTHGTLAGMPLWSPDGRKIAFGIRGPMGVELWVANALTGECQRAGNMMLNDVLGPAFKWMHDSDRLLTKVVPAYRGPAPRPAAIPTGPIIEETSPGKLAQVRTYQDLLQNADDERLFEYYATSQIAVVRSSTGHVHQLCLPDLYLEAEWSPDEKYLLVTILQKPFSYRVPYNDFSRRTEIRDANGQFVREVDNRPVSDDVPRQGVVKGPRDFRWQSLHPARLLWVEALDGGDPMRKVEYRDELLCLDAPFTAPPTPLVKTRHRLTQLDWTADVNTVLLTEYDRNRRWTTTYRIELDKPEAKTVLFDRSIRDDYSDPGTPLYTRSSSGHRIMRQEGDWAYFYSRGASPRGDYPRLDKINLRTGERQTVYACPEGAYEEFVMFEYKNTHRLVTRYQSKTEPPNFYLVDLKTKARKPLTQFTDPAPELTRAEKRLIKYWRNDGVPLSGILYLPPGYQPGQRLPLFIWAYPVEYSDAATAGQVRGSEHTFTYFRDASPLFLLTRGYAVLMNATMPIVGDPETMNDTFIEQTVASGRAAIDYLDSLGIIDRRRVGVGGHSYGAFMTATLLAHSDDYAYGIARSGAYNRTLTPFGFQNERRSFWEATEVYIRVSPFTYAHRINEPILLIHGEADNNAGTFPLQSERLFHAINGNGGIARLVILPYENHSYRARESILHVIAEMLEWAEKHGKK
ncbi:MAG: prolyl oligopeptidase family serine peptidase [Saprospiraceae bacterium]|nr:prolyl oligopeptidase family serine peptidase [Saprospiraceae bacterium]MDW8484766.1 prolyl oligopeptidase family serine peptidase [Saprospiraceae bacterium]